MKVKLGYRDKIVEVSNGNVFLFKEKLYSAPLEELVSYYFKGEGLLAPPLRGIAGDVVRAIMKTGEVEKFSIRREGVDQGVST